MYFIQFYNNGPVACKIKNGSLAATPELVFSQCNDI